jgi:hypothetical protein
MAERITGIAFNARHSASQLQREAAQFHNLKAECVTPICEINSWWYVNDVDGFVAPLAAGSLPK